MPECHLDPGVSIAGMAYTRNQKWGVSMPGMRGQNDPEWGGSLVRNIHFSCFYFGALFKPQIL